tara:strand:+ start:252 stop:1070 length:819 start_codon:yes stop_codon:yes gene_type:complete
MYPMYIKKIIKYINYFPYYLEIFAKRLNGRGLMNPKTNGEYKVLENLIKKKSFDQFTMIDGGSNIGDHLIKTVYFCQKYNLSNQNLFAVEVNTDLHEKLKINLKNIKFSLISDALSSNKGFATLYYDSDDLYSGQSSIYYAYYHNATKKIKTTTLDNIIESNNINFVDFVKLDIEGGEYNALIGAERSLSKGKINYIQLEYTQNWIEGGGSIKKVLDLIGKYNYSLFLIRKKDLLSIKKYNFHLDDFFYSNLLIVKNGCPYPLKIKRDLIPI